MWKTISFWYCERGHMSLHFIYFPVETMYLQDFCLVDVNVVCLAIQ